MNIKETKYVIWLLNHFHHYYERHLMDWVLNKMADILKIAVSNDLSFYWKLLDFDEKFMFPSL